MKYTDWMKASASGRFDVRSKELKRVDKALEAYQNQRTQKNLRILADALDDWIASKEDWRTSMRRDAVEKLMLYVRQQQGLPINRAAANFALRRTAQRNRDEYLVTINATQTLTYPPSYAAYCNQWFGGKHTVDFPMTINFGIVRHGTAFVINVRALADFDNSVGPGVVKDDVLSNWKTHCESTWNCAVLYIDQRKYDLLFNLIWVKPGAPQPYYEIKIHQPPPLTGQHTRQQVAQHARSGTPHLGQWGVDDRQAIAHEFGHMIGNPDEYLCTGFSGLAVPYRAAIYNNMPFTTDSIMNNTAENGCKIYERHFAMVVQQITKYLEETTPKPVPPVRVAIEKPLSPSRALLDIAILKRRRAMGYDD